MVLKLRHITALACILTMLFTAQAFAVARGASDATGKMVLCIGTTSVVVHIDAEGQPTAAPHICPDAAMSLALGADTTPDVTHPTVLRASDYAATEALAYGALHMANYLSRAPPVLL